MAYPAKKPKREPNIALINIVFLMLVFFMVAGTFARPLDPDLRLVETRDLEGRAPSDALVLHSDGRLTHQGALVADVAEFWVMQDRPADADARIVPDRAATAAEVVRLGRALREAGASRVLVVTERGLQ